MRRREEERITLGPSGKCTDLEIETLTEDQMMNHPEYPEIICLKKHINYTDSEYNIDPNVFA